MFKQLWHRELFGFGWYPAQHLDIGGRQATGNSTCQDGLKIAGTGWLLRATVIEFTVQYNGMGCAVYTDDLDGQQKIVAGTV